MTNGFEYLDHTSDVLVRAYGPSLEEAFRQAAMALMNILVQNLQSVSPTIKRHFKISSASVEGLLYKYLEEFLYIFDTERIIFSNFEIKIDENESYFKAEVIAYGEKFDPLKHKPGIEVKAITYHRMSINRYEDATEMIFLFDI